MNIAIIDCDYLGSEVASLWSKKGHHITATTRHSEKLEPLSKIAQKSVILKGNDEEELASLIASNEAIVIATAVDHSEHYESAHLNVALAFRHLALEMNLPRQLIHAGCVFVYGDHRGLWVDEAGELRAKGEEAKMLVEVEKTYLSLEELGWFACALRFAEVYGPGRELSKRVQQLEGHTLPGSGTYYTNMIHKLDAAHAIDYAFRHHLEGVYNAADDDHPTRKELYDLISHKFRLPKVKWDASLSGLHSGNKRISNHKLKAEGFSFRHPHRILD